MNEQHIADLKHPEKTVRLEALAPSLTANNYLFPSSSAPIITKMQLRSSFRRTLT